MTFCLEKILRENISSLVPYSSARSDFKGEAQVFLDANESPFSWGESKPPWNRYPDPLQQQLRKKIAALKDLPENCVFAANGSDEAIDLLIRATCKPGHDRLLTLKPSYGVYSVAAHINDISVDAVALNEDFTLDAEALLRAVTANTKIIFICSPNNPTGNCFEREDILSVAGRFDGLVVVDEAYLDFSGRHSMARDLAETPNLVVLQTMSKAWGLAGVRIGFAFASKEIIAVLDKVKSPYNMSSLNQEAALRALSLWRRKEQNVRITKAERERVARALTGFPFVKKVYPSDANFLLLRVDSASELYNSLLEDGIVIRNRNSEPGCTNCIRISIGTPEENGTLLDALAAITNTAASPSCHQNPARIAERSRSSSETSVFVRLLLDGSGKARINSGIPFFNHMLELMTFHASFDLYLDLEADLEVDAHHGIEDAALCLGEAFRSAIGDKKGIERYGYALPMDEALATIAIDLSGRPCLVYQAGFKGNTIGDMPTEMVAHFLKSFSDAALCTLHVTATGENDHHICEAIFKGFGRALKAAAQMDPRHKLLPSTKGIL